MKWLGASSAGAAGEPAPSMQLHHPSANGHIPTDAEQCGQVMAGGDSMRIQPGQTHQIGVNRTQDDAMVGYVFQRPTEAEFNAQSSTFQTNKHPVLGLLQMMLLLIIIQKNGNIPLLN
uniref:Uncharacterized protein n=1 Tax=Apis cerana TaxID=7461 RepID=V9IBS4_APICE